MKIGIQISTERVFEYFSVPDLYMSCFSQESITKNFLDHLVLVI